MLQQQTPNVFKIFVNGADGSKTYWNINLVFDPILYSVDFVSVLR